MDTSGSTSGSTSGNPEWISSNSGTPSEYYADGVLRHITEGMNGLEAATVIYDNDNTMMLKIKALENQIKAYEAMVAKLSGTSKTEITLEQGIGSGTTAVISQAGVTKVVDVLQEQIDDSVFQKVLVPEEKVTLNVKDLNYVTTADYAIKSAQDLEGHVISTMWHDIRDIEEEISGLTASVIELIEWKKKISG